MQTAPGLEQRNHPCYDFYHATMQTLDAAGVPYLVGGAFALHRFAGIARDTKDFDIFVTPGDIGRALDALAAAGYATELPFPHWLGKARRDEDFVDLIFSSGNGVATVDAEWFAYAVDEIVVGRPVKLCPPEEMLWSKAFVMERERYDGADVAHLLRACATTLDWPRLLRRFGGHWRVLFSHLIMFTFIYPGERGHIPAWVMQAMSKHLLEHLDDNPALAHVCRGTLLSRAQYLPDIEEWRYGDARIQPDGTMTDDAIAIWTSAAREEQ